MSSIVCRLVPSWKDDLACSLKAAGISVVLMRGCDVHAAAGGHCCGTGTADTGALTAVLAVSTLCEKRVCGVFITLPLALAGIPCHEPPIELCSQNVLTEDAGPLPLFHQPNICCAPPRAAVMVGGDAALA